MFKYYLSCKYSHYTFILIFYFVFNTIILKENSISINFMVWGDRIFVVI